MWFDEYKDYNYRANYCSGVCGHYTQVRLSILMFLGRMLVFDGYRLNVFFCLARLGQDDTCRMRCQQVQLPWLRRCFCRLQLRSWVSRTFLNFDNYISPGH